MPGEVGTSETIKTGVLESAGAIATCVVQIQFFENNNRREELPLYTFEEHDRSHLCGRPPTAAKKFTVRTGGQFVSCDLRDGSTPKYPPSRVDH